MRQEVGVDEAEEGVLRRVLQFDALVGLPLGQGLRRRAPIAPAVGRVERGPERHAQGLGFRLLALLLLVQDAQEEYPGQLWDVLHGAGAVAAAHDVADALDRLIH